MAMKSLIVLFTLVVCTKARYWPYWYPFIPAYPAYAVALQGSYFPPFPPSYPPPSYPQPSYPQPVYPQPSYPQPSYPQPLYPQPSYPQPSYPPQPLPSPAPLLPSPPQQNGGDEYAASLGGAPVGFYSRRQNTGPYGTNTEVSGVSLSNAKVGIYGKDRPAVSNPTWNV